MFELVKKNKTLFRAFIGLFVFMELFGVLLFAAPAKAGFPVFITESIPAKTEWGWEQVKKSLITASLGSLMHASSYFMRKMAYDGATYIASGGKGQGALAFKEGPAAYFEKLALDSSADLINEFGKPFGLNLCSTPDLQLQVFLQIGLHSLYWKEDGAGAGPNPSCTWQQLDNAWSAEAFEEKYGPGGSKFIAQNFTNALRFEDSDFGIALGAKAKIDRNNAAAVVGAAQERTEGQGFKPLTSLIDGKVKSPAKVVAEESKVISSKQQGDMTSSQLAGVYGSGFLQVIPMAASVFLNTLVGEGLKKAQKELLNLGKDKGGSNSAFEALSYESSGFQSSRKKAESIFSDLLTVSITQVNSYAQLEEFSACPDYPVKPGLNNCVMDSGLRQALEESNLDEPLTIAKALEKDYLHGSWPLYSPDRIADNLDKNCYQKGYCYPNIQKLRRARILPLGFEIAATLADPDDPETQWTLQQVVDGFFDCAEVELADGTIEVVEDLINHPYCHLIDPNWILKAPEARCNAQVYAANLLDDNKSGVRSQECVDVQSCIKENEDGSCEFFGYCTKEKNVWRFNADRCEPQYNTCTTFVSSEGDVDSYLARTLDYGNCSFESAGCRSYSTERNGDPAVTSTTWVASFSGVNKSFENAGRNQTVYFNQNIENYTDNCSEQLDGCSEFYTDDEDVSGFENLYIDPIYLQKAPDYLGCYDVEPCLDYCNAQKETCIDNCSDSAFGANICISACDISYDNCVSSENSVCADIDWPQTKSDLTVLENRPEACNDYAQVCLPSEIGCDAYTPVEGPTPVRIPGIIGENYCDESCANYETFRQVGTNFEPSEFPLYFIPDYATECSSDFAGCDEFTNIDELARGGEYLEQYSYIKYCERPADDNEKIFYSWEGSSQEGYVLKLHELRPITEEDFLYIENIETDLNLDEPVDIVYPVGSPAYASDTVSSLGAGEGGNYWACNQTNYNNLINNVSGDTALADCRALYDKDGKIYYRLLSDTITVSDECHPLRKTNSNLYIDDNIGDVDVCGEKFGVWGDVPGDNSDEELCQRCTAGGRYEDGSCIYWAMSGADESIACPATAVGCREYTGNSANNLHQVFLLDFDISDDAGEDALIEAKNGWSPSSSVSISPESIQVGLESLKITGDKVYYEFDNVFAYQDTFELSFWARGESQKLEIYFEHEEQDNPDYFTFSELTGESTSVSIGTEWRQYRVGPAVLSDVTSEKIKLVFDSDSDSLYFIDNLKLDRVNDIYYRIKDSWKKDYENDGVIRDVPKICDDTPDDPYPGLALGCRQYEEESTGSTDIYATGFDALCRENAIGCSALYETNNNLQVNTVIYNLWCQDNEGVGEDKKCELLFDPGEDQDTEVLGSCIVDIGEIGCFVDGPINEDDRYFIEDVEGEITNAVIKNSTVIIPGDSDDPVFLTDRGGFDGFRCTEKSKGCQEIALEERILPDELAEGQNAYEFLETFVLNDPDHYEETLCRSDLVGCGDFSVNNEKYYFKDPNITGNSFCEYKDEVTSDEVTYKGWFLRDFGTCGEGETETGDLCRTDDDCEEEVSCSGQGTVPCYEDYLLAGGEYGLWSNSSVKYSGLVGVCNESENGCREFIDPEDSSSLYPDGQAYYLIYNQKLIDPVSECEGQASLQEGCVLFNKTDYPNLLYNAGETYDDSEDNDFALATLVSDDNNDSNILLKVVRDRECAEWLSCQGYIEIEDTQAEGEKRKVCYALESCEKGTALNCVQSAGQDDYDNKILDQGLYINRDITWQKSRELSGYSIFNQYQIGDLDLIRVDTEETNLKDQSVFVGFVDKQYNIQCSEDYSSCGLGDSGICFNDKCIYSPIGDGFSKSNVFYEDLYGQDCRGYPEQDSPFEDEGNSAIVQDWNNQRPEYSNSSYVNSNICQEGEDCSCSYLRIGYGQYGQVTEDRFFDLDGKINIEYYNEDKDKIEGEVGIDNLKVIQGGDSDGNYCSDEVNPEKCSEAEGDLDPLSVVKKNRRIGWKGYCLERDYSHHINGRIDNEDDAYACLTWMPLDYVVSGFDIYNSDQSLGYLPDGSGGGKNYCAEAVGVADLNYVRPVGEQVDVQACSVGDTMTVEYNCGHELGENYCLNTPVAYFPGVNDPCFAINSSIDYLFHSSDRPKYSFNHSHFEKSAREFLQIVNVGEDVYTTDKVTGQYSYAYISRADTANSFYNDNFIGPTRDNIQRSQIEGALGEGDTGEANYVLLQKLLFRARIANRSAYDFAGNGASDTTELGVLLPDGVRVPWIIDKIGDENFKPLTNPNSEDSGIIENKPSKYEDFLNKKILSSVSLVPLSYDQVNQDNNHTELKENPQFGYHYEINFDEIDELYEKGEISELKSVGGSSSVNCTWCNWWVMKVDHPNNQVGYVVQWWHNDPAQEWLGYEDSYNINPLEVNNGEVAIGCDGDDEKVNWWAVEYLFDKTTDNFEGYRSRWCEATDNRHGLSTAVVWNMKPYCAKATQVYDDTPETGISTNKAYTNKLWDGAEETSIKIANQDYSFDLSMSPYGSGRAGIDITNPGNNDMWNFGQIEEGDGADAGYPYNCVSVGENFEGVCATYPTLLGENNINIPSSDSTKNVPITIDEDENAWWDGRINQLFAKAMRVTELNSDYEWTKVDTVYDDAFEKGTPPVIFYPAEEFTEDTDFYKNRFAVNSIGKVGDQLYGKGNLNVQASFYTWADHDQMPLRRIMIDWGNNGINQSGAIAGIDPGYYKNFKPICETDAFECSNTGLTCDPDNEFSCPENVDCQDVGLNYGNQSDKCEPEPLIAGWNYTCDITAQDKSDYIASGLTPTTQTGRLTTKPYVYNLEDITEIFGSDWETLLAQKGHTNNNELFCVFQPRVQVLDNWGWCTGGCDYDERGGCYNFGDLVDNCEDPELNNFIPYSDIVVVAP